MNELNNNSTKLNNENDDLISRQSALECFEWTNTKAGAKRAIETLPSAQPDHIAEVGNMVKWIPVKWREPTEEESKYYTYMADCEMPDDEQEILVTRNGYVEKDVCYYEDSFSLDSGADWQDVTAWMPLPEPYRG